MASETNFYVRLGAAAEAGAPIGASVDIARSTRTTAESAQAGQAFAGAGAAFFQPGVAPQGPDRIVARAEPEPEKTLSFWDRVGGAVSGVGRPILRALEWGTEATGNIAETDLRMATRREGSPLGMLRNTANQALPFLRLFDAGWREEWEKVVDAEASIGQTMYLLAEERAPWAPGTSGSGIEDPVTGEFGPRVSSGGLDLLDNPERRAERQEYFSEGMARWTTGVGDALWQVFADPLIVGAKVGGVAKAAATTLRAEDVAKVADRSIDAAQLTKKQARSRNLVRQLAESFEDAPSGAITNAARSKYLRNSTDGGAIAYFMERAAYRADGSLIDDKAARIAAREDVIYAGMGDQAALARLGERSELLRVELDKMLAPDSALPDVDHLMFRADKPAQEALDEALDEANQRVARELRAQRSLIERDLEAINRVIEVGRPVEGATANAVGELAKAPLTKRSVARVVKTRQNGRFLEPLQYVTGRHLPGTFKLSEDGDAAKVFHEAVLRARRVAVGLKSDQRKVFDERLRALEDDFLAAGVGASSKAARGLTVARFDSLVDEMVAIKYGVDRDALGAVHDAMRGRRKAHIRAVATRAYKARQAGEPVALHTGDNVMVFGDDAKWIDDFGSPGERVAAADARVEGPVLRSQVEDFVSIVDPRQLDTFAATHFRDGLGGFVKRLPASMAEDMAGVSTRTTLQRGLDAVDPRRLRTLEVRGHNMYEVGEHLLAWGNRLWKFGALLRPGAYFVRAQVDTQLRNLAKLGALKYFAGAAQGLGNKAWNLRKMDKAEAAALAARFHAHQRIGELERLALHSNDKAIADELAKLREEVAKPIKFKRTGEMVRYGQTESSKRIGKSARIDRDGTYTPPKETDAYLSNEHFLRTVSSFDSQDAVLGVLLNGARSELDQLRRTGDWGLVPGHNLTSWEPSFLRAVNHQIRSDALGKRLLAGQTDDEILAWFKSDPEGRKYLRDMRVTGSESAMTVVQEARQHIDTLLPEGSEVRSIALARDLKQGEPSKLFGDPFQRPHVPGELLGENMAGRIVKFYESLERGYFKWVAQIPENMMGRHPLYAGRFENHAGRLIESTGVDRAALTLDQLNSIRRKADQLARRDVARYMFDTSKTTNAGQMLRFASPFYGAWEDTMVKWGRIFGEKPEALLYGWKGVRAPNAAGLVVDEDGNRVDPQGKVYDADGNHIKTVGMWDGYLILPVPGPLQKWAGAKDVRVAKNAANVVFQGDPWFLPGPGPVAAIPANELVVRMFPEAWGEEGSENPILKYLLPFGPTSDPVWEQVAPSWARAAHDLMTQDGRRHSQVFTQLYMEQLHAERNGQVDPLTDDERLDAVANRTRNWLLLRLIGTEMPMTFTPQSRLDFFRSEYQRYRREFGAEADDRFLEDYPDYFEMTISLSADETGIRATDESWGAVQKYRNDIAKHPEFGWFWAGAANLDPGWSQGVYHAQLAQQIGPGSSKTFRSRKDPLEAAREVQVEQGWREYRQLMTALDLQLEARGGVSLNSAAARDLAAIKERFVADLSRRNQDWAAAYQAGGNSGRVTEFLTLGLDQMRAHPELLERSDVQALAQYIELRETLRGLMFERHKKEVARPDGATMVVWEEGKSINHEDNADLLEIWQRFTSELVRRDPGFEQMFTRVLERDDLSGDTYGQAEEVVA